MINKNILVTGGAGFIGSHFVDSALDEGFNIVVLDALTYAADLNNLKHAQNHKNFRFIQGDISDEKLVSDLLVKHKIMKIFNFAAETHVDNSIYNPEVFITTNIVGTSKLLSASLHYWQTLKNKEDFRFIHVSTDEVFGDLKEGEPAFHESTSYSPNSPYSASKAASDHLVRAWGKTYKLPVITTYCSNNYGSRQHSEKLIPYMIKCALADKPLPIYGSGQNIRDWLYVKDHCRGVLLAGLKGKPGETYCFGGNNQITNLEIVKHICKILDNLKPRSDGDSYSKLISFVKDRPGHDLRYHVNFTKAAEELGYKPEQDFEKLLKETIAYYINDLQ
ncbi:dTDP-glucose 4,6-dehydratase [Holosporaceae bacterium 'Namur']|nr:dTDP-glucose 4,6-dehydratase [Holosporaceae bacterium 'Namur']